MSYKVGHKVIVNGELFKIKKIHEGNFFSCCASDGCSSLVMFDRIHQTYIGDADPEFFHSAKTIKEEAEKLRSILNLEDACDLETCSVLDRTISEVERLMEKFYFESEKRKFPPVE